MPYNYMMVRELYLSRIGQNLDLPQCDKESILEMPSDK